MGAGIGPLKSFLESYRGRKRVAEFHYGVTTLRDEMSRKGIVIGVVAALFVIGLTFVAGWMFLRQTRKVAQEVFIPHEEQIDLTALVTRVRAINRLETASMRVVHVSTISQT